MLMGELLTGYWKMKGQKAGGEKPGALFTVTGEGGLNNAG
jgi:hypothetical protein